MPDGYSNEQPSFFMLTIDTITTGCILSLLTSVTEIIFDCINNSILTFLNNTCMVDSSATLSVKGNNCSGCRLTIAVCLQTSVFKLLNAFYTTDMFWNNTDVDISALIGTPRNKASAPFYPRVETMPKPVRRTSDIAPL